MPGLTSDMSSRDFPLADLSKGGGSTSECRLLPVPVSKLRLDAFELGLRNSGLEFVSPSKPCLVVVVFL